MTYRENIVAFLLLTILSLIILLPLLPPGYILTLDQVMTAKIAFPSFSSPSFLFGSFLWSLNLFLPSYWLQKLTLFFIFFLSGWGMYRLVSIKNNWARIFAGIFYAVNPFVYERVMAGQWGFLLGYALFPFFVSFLLDFFDNPSKNSAIKLAVFSTIIVSTVIHFSLILASFFLIYGLIFILFHQNKISLLWKYFLVLGGLVFILNINWLIPTIFRRSELNEAISQFTHEDLIAFQSVEDKRFGLIFNLLSGYGFWPEVYPYFILPKDIVFIWPLISVIFIVLSAYGLIKLFKERSFHPLIITLVIMFFLSLDFAGGVALKSFAPTAFWFYQKLPILRGFREPQKLVGVIMFCYAFFASYGFSCLLNKAKESSLFFYSEQSRRIVLCSLFFALPFLYTPTVFGGFWGQLKPVFYPQSWEKVNEILKEDQDNFLTVFFPWHMYMKFGFNHDRVVANPAPYYFDQPILSSQNYETKPLYSHDVRPEALHVDGLLNIQMEGKNLLGDQVYFLPDWGKDLAVVDVKYIILAKDDDFREYKFLDRVFDFNKVYESDELILYQNLFWGKEIPLLAI